MRSFFESAVTLLIALSTKTGYYVSSFSVLPSPYKSHVVSRHASTNTAMADVRLYSSTEDSTDITSTATTTDTTTTSDITYTLPFDEESHEELMYALGVNLARQLGDIRPLVEDGVELTQVAKGILDCVVGRLEDTAQRDVLARRGEELNALIVSRADNLRKKIEDMGRNMLQQMSETEGTITLDSGVVIHPLEPGKNGEDGSVRPTLASSVKVHYHGTLPDGTVFDSSLVKGGEPVRFAIAQVIPGWKEGLLKMHEGQTCMIGIPPEQGYGAEGTPDGRIPGGATLFFKVELLEVLSGGIGGTPSLLGADGKKLSKDDDASTTTLLGADGKPLF